jgi:hypothetical protein
MSSSGSLSAEIIVEKNSLRLDGLVDIDLSRCKVIYQFLKLPKLFKLIFPKWVSIEKYTFCATYYVSNILFD